MGSLQWVLALIVTGIGALVLVYCALLLPRRRAGAPAFAGVWSPSPARCSAWSLADDLILLYVFWELTTVFSYLLIGHDPTRRAEPGRGDCRR